MGLKCHPIEGPTQLAQFANLPCLLTQSRVVITMALALYFVPMDKFGRKIAVPKCARKSIPSKLHPLSKTAIASNTSIPFLPSLASLFLPSLASLTKPPYQEMALKCLPASKSSGLLNSEKRTRGEMSICIEETFRADVYELPTVPTPIFHRSCPYSVASRSGLCAKYVSLSDSDRPLRA